MFNAELHYLETIKALEAEIIARYTSVRKFCQVHKIGYHNLNKVFSDNVKHELGIGLYLRICVALQIEGVNDCDIAPDIYSYRISLKHYLRIPNNQVLLTLLSINRL